MPPIGYTVNIVPVDDPSLSFRHCYSQGFITPTDSNPDHQFKLVPALNGDAGAISFQSINYPTSYIAPVTTAEPGRLGIVQGPPADDASWTIANSGAGVTITLRSRALSMTVGSNLTGICASSYAPPSASVYLESATTNASVWVLSSTGVSLRLAREGVPGAELACTRAASRLAVPAAGGVPGVAHLRPEPLRQPPQRSWPGDQQPEL